MIPVVTISVTSSISLGAIFLILISLRKFRFRHIGPEIPEEQIFSEFKRTSMELVTMDGYLSEIDISQVEAIRLQLRQDIKESGWPEIRKKFIKSVSNAFGTQWYSENEFLLQLFEIEEYLGYDGSVLDLLKKIDTYSDFNDLKQSLQSALINRLRVQIQNGGNTSFLDIEKFKEERSVLIIPVILVKRKENFIIAWEKYRGPQKLKLNYKFTKEKRRAALYDVLSTNYGFQVVRAITKEEGNPIQVQYFINQLKEVYDTLIHEMTDKHNPIIVDVKDFVPRDQTPWIQLCKEIALNHIREVTGYTFGSKFNYCNPDFMQFYQSGYSDIFKILRRIDYFPKLYKSEYTSILRILDGLKTKKASETLSLMRMNAWIIQFVHR